MRTQAVRMVRGAILVSVGLGLFFGAAYMAGQRRADATIIASGVKHERVRSSGGKYGPFVDRYSIFYEYTYVAGGKSHTGGGQVQPVFRAAEDYRSPNAYEDRVSSEYPVGKILTVYYDPAKPDSHRLRKSDQTVYLQILGIATAVIGTLCLLPPKANPIYLLKAFVERHRLFSDPRKLAKLAAVFFCAGVLVFGAALLSGVQSNIFVFCPVGLILAFIGFVAASFAYRPLFGRILIGVSLVVLILGVLILVYISSLGSVLPR